MADAQYDSRGLYEAIWARGALPIIDFNDRAGRSDAQMSPTDRTPSSCVDSTSGGAAILARSEEARVSS
jgi:hypothetical protein